MTETTVEQTESTQPEQVATEAPSEQPTEFATDAEIMKMMEEPKAEAEKTEEEEPEEEQEEPEGKQASEEEPKKRKSWGQREREARLQAEENYRKEIQERDQRLQKVEADNKELISMIEKIASGNKKPAARTEDSSDVPADVLDEVTFNEVKKLKEELVNEKVEAVIEQAHEVGSKTHPQYNDAREYFVASEAYKVIMLAESAGKQVKEEDALNYAYNAVNKELAAIAKNGGNKNNLANYVYKQALARGYKADQASAQPQRAKVNMKAVEKARQEAGAPTIARESVKISGANWQDDLAAQYKDKYGKVNQNYLRMMGVG